MKIKLLAITILTVILLSIVPSCLVQAKGPPPGIKPIVPNYYVEFKSDGSGPTGSGNLQVSNDFSELISETDKFEMDLSFASFGKQKGTLNIYRIRHGLYVGNKWVYRFEWITTFYFQIDGTKYFMMVSGTLVGNKQQGGFTITPLYYDDPVVSTGYLRICLYTDYPYPTYYKGWPYFTVTGTAL